MQDKKQTKTHSDHLGHQHELLEQKLKAFEETNRNLRRLLREQHGREVRITSCTEESCFCKTKFNSAFHCNADRCAENVG